MKLLTLSLLFCLTLPAQEKISLAIYQDISLAVKEDTHGNKPFTLDIIAQLKMQGNQQKYGYMIIYPEIEYAKLTKEYSRYSANIGYTLNFVNNFEATLSGGWGMISRNNSTWHSASLNGVVGYKLKYFKANLMAQFTDRKDIGLWRFSTFLGLEIDLINLE